MIQFRHIISKVLFLQTRLKIAYGGLVRPSGARYFSILKNSDFPIFSYFQFPYFPISRFSEFIL